MPIRKRLFVLLTALLLLCGVSMTAFAHDVPDLSEKGSVKITMSRKGEIVPGGTLTLYQVGSVREDDGNYSFELTGDFVKSKVSLKNVESARTAKALAEYAEEKNLTGITKEIGKDGKATFSGLNPGLYLLVQEENAPGYHLVDPFLVSIPMLEDGTYLYDVDAGPKVELVESPKKPHRPTPENPSNPPSPSAPGTSGPSGTLLPQTGQMNWPIPVLTICGLCLFAAGWYLRFGRSGKYEN